MRTVIIALSFLTQLPAHAEEVFGLQFGAPLMLQGCPRLKIDLPGYLPPYQTVKESCLKDVRGDAQEAVGTIAYPIGAGASHSATGDLTFVAIGGILEALAMTTSGAPVQHIVLRDMRQKFGEPTSSVTTRLVNALGGAVDSISATWATPTLRAEFVGVAGDFNSGHLVIGTPVGVSRYWERQRAAFAPRRPL